MVSSESHGRDESSPLLEDVVRETQPESSDTHDGTMDAFEAIDTFVNHGDLDSLKRILDERVSSRFAEGIERLGSGNPRDVRQFIANIRGRIFEAQVVDQESFYALLSIAKLPGYSDLEAIVQDVVDDAEHPHYIAALQAFDQDGNTLAAHLLGKAQGDNPLNNRIEELKEEEEEMR